MKITVIIPVYNEGKNIKACLDTLLNQTEKIDKIIVIDDDSTDNTRKIVEKYPVLLLSQSHRGPGAARNLAATKASDGILVFVDGDMTFDEEFVKNLTEPIKKGNTKGVFNLDEFVSNWDQPLARAWNYNNNLPDRRRMNPDIVSDVLDFRAILKSEFDRVGGFSLTGYTDSHTLSHKLGYNPTPIKNAISYHANPATLKEVYHHSRWIGKRLTKYGLLGKTINLLKYSFPVSVCIGLIKAAHYQLPAFIPFKIIYDLGFSHGILLSLINHSSSK